MGAFSYGWGQDDQSNPQPDPNNPLQLGGAIGSQPGSQTGGSGAGLTSTPVSSGWGDDLRTPDAGAGAGAAGASTPPMQTQSIAPTGPAPGGGTATPTQAPPMPNFGDLLSKIQTAATPQDAALQKDALSRSLYQTLSAQGHDVKWDGDQLMVDGRPYVVGGQATEGMLPSQAPPMTPGQTPSASGPAGAAGLTGSAPQHGQWAENNQGFLDWATKTFGRGPDGSAFINLPPGTSFEQVLERYRQETGNRADFLGGPSGDRVDFGQGPQDALTSSGQIWNNESTGAGGPGGSRPAPGGGGTWTGGPDTWGAPGAPGAVAQPKTTSEWGDMLKRLMAGSTPGGLTMGDVTGGLGDPLADDGWRPGGGGYVPGEIGMSDVEGLPGYEQLLADMGKGQEGTNALLARLMANPESMGQATTDTMKAQMKDTLAEQQMQEEEDLRGFGAEAGIADSPWLAAQRSASRRGRDMAVAKGAQDVDIKAATTNMADRRAAAGLGLQAGSQRQAAVQAASSAALAKAAATGDRLGLRESVKQQAAQLKISEDQVMSNFLQSKSDNLMKKYGIDLGAALDVKKLNQQSQEFREDLMQKMSALEQSLSMQKYGIDVGAATSKYGTDVGAGTSRYGVDTNARLTEAQRRQQDEQFAAQLGLSYQEFNRLKSNDDWKRMTDLYGGAQ